MRKIKNIARLLITMCLIFSISACGTTQSSKNNDTGQKQEISAISQELQQSETETEKTSDIEEITSEVLVVYFSGTGNTESVANIIATITNADIYEIIPEQPYSDEDLNYGNDDSRTSIEMNAPNSRPAIGGNPLSLDGYQTIYLGYPIWWGESPRIISTFVESYDFTDITIIPFCTSRGSDIGNSDDNLREQAGSGNWLDGKRFNSPTSQEEVQSWIDELIK